MGLPSDPGDPDQQARRTSEQQRASNQQVQPLLQWTRNAISWQTLAEGRPIQAQANQLTMVATLPLVAIPIILVTGLMCGHVPLYLSRSASPVIKGRLLLGNLISSGVFLSGSLVHLLPDAADMMKGDEMDCNSTTASGGGSDDDDEGFPTTFVLCGAGFLITLLVEHSLQLYLESRPEYAAKRRQQAFRMQAWGESDDSEPLGEDMVQPVTASTEFNPAVALASSSVASSLLMLVALSFHSLLAGIGLGLEGDQGRTFGLFVAIMAHKGLAAFALGNSLVTTSLSTARQSMLLVAFSLATPLGIAIGLSVGLKGESRVAGGCLALASGTFLYVGVFELMHSGLAEGRGAKQNDRAPSVPMFHRLGAIVLGYTLMSVLAVWT
eukprot:m.486812 g.486812  ORF g.486812 m.486812 type:complete len:382 (+) comp24606_c0_seq1:2-1147(+)